MLWAWLNPPKPNGVLRIKWYLRLRWIFIFALAVPGIVALYVGNGWGPLLLRDIYLALFAFASNACFAFSARYIKSSHVYHRLAMLMLVSDIVLVTLLIYIKGGTESRSVMLYAVPVLMSAIIFGRRYIHILSLVCVGIYASLMTLDYLDIVRPLDIRIISLHDDISYLANTVIFFGIIIILIGVMADFIVQYQHFAHETMKAMRLAQSYASLGSWEWDLVDDHLRWTSDLNDIFHTSISTKHASFADLLAVTHPDDQAQLSQMITQALRRRNLFSIEHRIIGNDSQVRHAQTEGKPTVDSRGEVLSVIGTTRDETEDKLIEESRKELLTLASHQLRTPATIIKQHLGMILHFHPEQLTKEDWTLLESAYSNNEHQLAIINDFLSSASITSGKISADIETVDIKELIDTVLAQQKSLFSMRQQSVVTVFGKQSEFMVDASGMRTVLDNIISNASKYSPHGSTIRVRLAINAKQLKISVEDQGIGIAKKDMGKLFQKFSRLQSPLSAKVGGHGLGLYIAQKTIAQQNGIITASPRRDKGTVFTIVVPQPKKPRKTRKTDTGTT